MKAFVVAALVAAAAAAPTYSVAPIGTTYARQITGTPGAFLCELQPGYAVRYAGTNVATPPAGTNTTVLTYIVAAGTGCGFFTGTAVAPQQLLLHLVCAAGWNSAMFANGVSSVTNGPQAGGVAAWAQATTYTPTTTNTYAFDTATTFICIRNTCPYTCSGAGCVIGSGSLSSSTTAQICACGWYPRTGTTSVSNIFSCPVAGIAATTAFTCSNDATATNSVTEQNIVGRIAVARTIPKACNCNTASPACPSNINTNSPTCTACNTCVIRREEEAEEAAEEKAVAARQFTGQRIVYCINAITWAAIDDCFTQARCAGVIDPDFDLCVINSDFCTSCGALSNTTSTTNYVFNSVNTLAFTCPTCPGKSKKLLLLLLLLLLLIPLVLCFSLCCLLFLCCIRRKKKGVPAHMATFDAGAAPLAPVFTHTHEVPLAHHHHTVHSTTHVGPEHGHGFVY